MITRNTTFSRIIALAACLAALYSAADQDGGRTGSARPRAMDKEKKFRNGPAAELMGPKEGRMGTLLEHVLDNQKLVSELGLTAEQIAALKTASEDFRRLQSELAARQEEEGILQARLLMGSEQVDEEKIMQAIERAGQARIEMAKARVKQLLVIQKTLTPEQMDKVQELIRQKINSRSADDRKPMWKERVEQWRKREPGQTLPPCEHTRRRAEGKGAE